MNISFNGTLTEQEFNRFNEIAMPALLQWILKLFPWLLLGYVLVKIIGLPGYIDSPELIIDVILLLFFFFFLPQLRKYQIKKAWASNKLIQGEIAGVINELGITWSHTYGEMRFSWDIILKYRESKDMFLLYTAINQALILPRSFFHSEEDWQKFKQLITQKLNK